MAAIGRKNHPKLPKLLQLNYDYFLCMFLRVEELIIYNSILALSKI